jgi:hypothetical protein
MSNFQKAAVWFLRALKWGIAWGIAGLFVGIAVATWTVWGVPDPSDDGGKTLAISCLFFGSIGVGLGAVIPLLVAAWHLFLHMLGQISSSIKNG